MGTKLGNRVGWGGFMVLAFADMGSEDPPWRAPVFILSSCMEENSFVVMHSSIT